MNYISKKTEKKIFYNLNNKLKISFEFLNFNFSIKKKNRYFLKYLLEVGLLKK